MEGGEGERERGREREREKERNRKREPFDSVSLFHATAVAAIASTDSGLLFNTSIDSVK
jgi:hypothetical protein